MTLREIKEKVLCGEETDFEEATFLYCETELEQLCAAAKEIRARFCGNGFDLCSIVNAKNGGCSEDCKFCAQAGCHGAQGIYSLLGAEELVCSAKRCAARGALRFSIVAAGRKLSERETDEVCESVRVILRQVPQLKLCASLGLLSRRQFERLKEAGVTRVHNNLETSQNYFSAVCTTHTFADKIAAIEAAIAAGLGVCSGGIMGIGESVRDRIDMAVTLRALGVRSVPVNMLNPIPGTPLEKRQRLSEEEMRRIVAVYRFILPSAAIRLAGGRALLSDRGRGCFLSGANAAITGDMLTTSGAQAESDLKMLNELGFMRRLSE